MDIGKVTLNVTPGTATTNAAKAFDSESKELQNQITNEQRRLKKLDSNEEMTAEEKAKERQEIQKQIAELNRKLQLQRLEQKEEKEKIEKQQEKKEILQEESLQEEKNERVDDKKTDAKKQEEAVVFEKKENKALELQDVQAMFAVGSLVQRDRVQDSVLKDKDGKENVLEAEIKLDEIYGSDTTEKKEELSAMRKEKPVQLEIQEPQVSQDFLGVENNVKIIIKE